MAWVKLHDDILGDPKLMRAARVGGQELVLLPWLLAFASKSADHGRLSVGATAAEPEDIAYQIPGVTAAQVEAALRALVAIGVLFADEDGCLRFTKWEERQAKPSDSKAAWRERKQRSRANGKAVTPSRAGHSVTEGHAGDVTPCHATDKKRGEEKREEVEERTDFGSSEDEPSDKLTIRYPAPSKLVSGVYPPEFEATWVLYPRRPNNSKKAAYGAWRTRVVSREAAPEELHCAVERYGLYCTARGIVGTETVLMGQTFFGPHERWRGEYTLPAPAQSDAPRVLRATEMVIS